MEGIGWIPIFLPSSNTGISPFSSGSGSEKGSSESSLTKLLYSVQCTVLSIHNASQTDPVKQRQIRQRLELTCPLLL